MKTENLVTKKRKEQVTLPTEKNFIYQSNRITNAIYDYNLIQEKLFNTIIFQLQDAIQVSFKNQDYQQLTIWKDINTDSEIHIKVPLSSVSKPQHYDSVKMALKKMAATVIEIPIKKANTDEPYLKIGGLLVAEIPKKPNYNSVIDIYIKQDIAKFLIEIDKDSYGKPIHWTYFMYQITQAATNKYTPKIYKLLCSWKKKGAFTISLDEFRQWLGIENKYKDFSDIKARILIPVQKDLEGKSDVWFNCKATDFLIKNGNTVTHLNFKVISPDLIETEAKNKDYVLYLLRTHFKFDDKHIDEINPIFCSATTTQILSKIMELSDYYRNNSNKIPNVTNYVSKSLLNEFCSKKLF